MAVNYKHSGKRLKVVAAADRTSGAVVSDVLASGGGTVAGVALANAASGQSYWIAASGIYNVTVPSATTAGTLLYAPGNTGGPTAGAVTLTATATNNTLFGKTLTDADASNKADVLVFEPRY